MKRHNDNHSPGPVIRELVPSSQQRSELSNTILCIFSRWDQRIGEGLPILDSLEEEATLINICISNGSLKCHRVLISTTPSFGDKVICWYTAFTEAPFLDLHLSISNGFVSSKIYDKRDDFEFDIVNFPFLDGDVPRSTSYGVYISQLIRFARVSSHVADFNARNKSLTAKLLQQGYRYHKLRKTFSKFYRRHYEFVSKFNVGLKTLLHQGLSEPEFYVDLVYKFKNIVGRADFSDQFKKLSFVTRFVGYNINIMRQSACLVFNPITVNNFASLFNCTPVGRASDSMMAPT